MEETNNNMQGFNFEYEFSKAKIPVPLIELLKIPSLRDHAHRMLKSQANEIPSDIINL